MVLDQTTDLEVADELLASGLEATEDLDLGRIDESREETSGTGAAVAMLAH